jgi:hypothetical protein
MWAKKIENNSNWKLIKDIMNECMIDGKVSMRDTTLF